MLLFPLEKIVTYLKKSDLKSMLHSISTDKFVITNQFNGNKFETAQEIDLKSSVLAHHMSGVN